MLLPVDTHRLREPLEKKIFRLRFSSFTLEDGVCVLVVEELGVDVDGFTVAREQEGG